MKVLFLKPIYEGMGKNIVRDFVYGCWCNGRRIGGMQMPPINELYCATHVANANVETEFLDAQSNPQRWTTLKKTRFDSIGIVVIMCSTQSFRDDCRIIREIKEKNQNVKAVLFGSHPTFMPEFCVREEEVDYIVLREPEQTLQELAVALLNNESIDELPGIAYQGGNKEMVMNVDRPFMKMDDLPIPDRTLLPEGIDYFNPAVKRVPYTTMQTSRGCPGRCIFCTSPFFYGKQYRFRSAEKVMEEFRQIKALGYREVFIRDETFTTNKKRNMEICQSMIKENLGLSWIANGRVDLIDLDALKLMKQAGCHLIKFGVETGNDEILKNYKKGTSTAQARLVFKWAKDVGLDTHAHMVIGGPGETRETIANSVKFVKEIKASTASFGILTPYPGTPLFDMVVKKHPEIYDGSESTMDNLHTEGFFSEAICSMSGDELSQEVTTAYRKFYLRPVYLLERLLSVRSFNELMIKIVGGLNIFSFSLTGNK